MSPARSFGRFGLVLLLILNNPAADAYFLKWNANDRLVARQTTVTSVAPATTSSSTANKLIDDIQRLDDTIRNLPADALHFMNEVGDKIDALESLFQSLISSSTTSHFTRPTHRTTTYIPPASARLPIPTSLLSANVTLNATVPLPSTILPSSHHTRSATHSASHISDDPIYSLLPILSTLLPSSLLPPPPSTSLNSSAPTPTTAVPGYWNSTELLRPTIATIPSGTGSINTPEVSTPAPYPAETPRVPQNATSLSSVPLTNATAILSSVSYGTATPLVNETTSFLATPSANVTTSFLATPSANVTTSPLATPPANQTTPPPAPEENRNASTVATPFANATSSLPSVPIANATASLSSSPFGSATPLANTTSFLATPAANETALPFNSIANRTGSLPATPLVNATSSLPSVPLTNVTASLPTALATTTPLGNLSTVLPTPSLANLTTSLAPTPLVNETTSLVSPSTNATSLMSSPVTNTTSLPRLPSTNTTSVHISNAKSIAAAPLTNATNLPSSPISNTTSLPAVALSNTTAAILPSTPLSPAASAGTSLPIYRNATTTTLLRPSYHPLSTGATPSINIPGLSTPVPLPLETALPLSNDTALTPVPSTAPYTNTTTAPIIVASSALLLAPQNATTILTTTTRTHSISLFFGTLTPFPANLSTLPYVSLDLPPRSSYSPRIPSSSVVIPTVSDTESVSIPTHMPIPLPALSAANASHHAAASASRTMETGTGGVVPQETPRGGTTPMWRNGTTTATVAPVPVLNSTITSVGTVTATDDAESVVYEYLTTQTITTTFTVYGGGH